MPEDDLNPHIDEGIGLYGNNSQIGFDAFDEGYRFSEFSNNHSNGLKFLDIGNSQDNDRLFNNYFKSEEEANPLEMFIKSEDQEEFTELMHGKPTASQDFNDENANSIIYSDYIVTSPQHFNSMNGRELDPFGPEGSKSRKRNKYRMLPTSVKMKAVEMVTLLLLTQL